MTPATDPPSQAGWHLDKKVPLALIFAICVQTGGAVWWVSDISRRVSNVETSLSGSLDQPARIVRVETQMEGVRGTLKEMNDKLDRLLGYPAPVR